MTIFVIVDVSKRYWIVTTFAFRVSQTVYQGPTLWIEWLVLQGIHHGSVLIMEQLQDGSVALLFFNHIVHFFL